MRITRNLYVNPRNTFLGNHRCSPSNLTFTLVGYVSKNAGYASKKANYAKKNAKIVGYDSKNACYVSKISGYASIKYGYGIKNAIEQTCRYSCPLY